VATGNLGESLRTQEPVLGKLLQGLPITVELSLMALVMAACFGIPLGIVSAIRRNSGVDFWVAPLIVTSTLSLSTAILTEASLSFLGLGVQPPQPSWGTMLNTGRRVMEIAPWVVIFPGIAIMLVVQGFNFFGDGLRDALDPKLRGT
jgi:ABC-type dipeptide/oligopeptide/nickel transport system permease subunit